MTDLDFFRERQEDMTYLESLKKPCYTYNGTGKVMFMVSKDDSDIETCTDCDGLGYREPDDDPVFDKSGE